MLVLIIFGMIINSHLVVISVDQNFPLAVPSFCRAQFRAKLGELWQFRLFQKKIACEGSPGENLFSFPPTLEVSECFSL